MRVVGLRLLGRRRQMLGLVWVNGFCCGVCFRWTMRASTKSDLIHVNINIRDLCY